MESGGLKVRLSTWWETALEHFGDAPSPVYGETDTTLRYYTLDLLWRPVGQRVRFVLVAPPRLVRIEITQNRPQPVIAEVQFLNRLARTPA